MYTVGSIAIALLSPSSINAKVKVIGIWWMLSGINRFSDSLNTLTPSFGRTSTYGLLKWSNDNITPFSILILILLKNNASIKLPELFITIEST